MYVKIKVERPEAGKARICWLNKDGSIQNEYTETDAAKADALTSALEAGGKLGVDIGDGA